MLSRQHAAGLVLTVLLQACASNTPSKPGDTSDQMPPGSPAQMPVDMNPAPTGMAGAPATDDMKPVDMKPADMQPADMKPVDMKPADMPTDTPKMAMDECGLNTKWLGDEYCINPPPKDKGFQIHVGPTDYDNPDPKYVLEPGEETNEIFPGMTGNTEDVYFLVRQYRMRPGSHHLIVSGGGAGGGLGGTRLGGTQNLAKDDPVNSEIAPENEGLGIPLAANTAVTNSLHYINLTEGPILKETWVNFWYRDKALVKEPAITMYSFAPISVQPHTHVVLHGSCPITGPAGRVIQIYGHRHANNLRFSAWHEHGGQKDLLFEDYDWQHPAVLEYTSLVTNTLPDPGKKIAGGASGVVNIAAGDTMSFECDIVNDTDQSFVGKNEAENDEMCILIGATVGASVSTRCSYMTTVVP
jgi:hypothetical protein